MKKKAFDFDKAQMLLYKISDITEVSIRCIDSINCGETNQLKTVLEAQRHFTNQMQAIFDGDDDGEAA